MTADESNGKKGNNLDFLPTYSGGPPHHKTPLGTLGGGCCYSPLPVFQTPSPIKEELAMPPAPAQTDTQDSKRVSLPYSISCCTMTNLECWHRPFEPGVFNYCPGVFPAQHYQTWYKYLRTFITWINCDSVGLEQKGTDQGSPRTRNETPDLVSVYPVKSLQALSFVVDHC